MTPLEQASHTPATVLFSASARGLVPRRRMLQLDPSGQKYYFQNDHAKICLTRFNNGPYIKTPARLAQQLKFKNAVAAWAALPIEQKIYWNSHPQCSDRSLPGRNVFISTYLRTH